MRSALCLGLAAVFGGVVGCDSDPSANSQASSGGSSNGGSSSTSASGGSMNEGGSAVGGAAGSGAGGSGGDGGTGGRPPDPCLDLMPSCPVTPDGQPSGSGLVPLDRCAFPLDEQGFDVGSASLASQLAQALTTRPLTEVLADLNRVATIENSVPGNPSNVSQAFGWNSGDQNVDYWIPQGLTGSADASANGLVSGREVVLASWYYDIDSDPTTNGEKGVRVSLADVTDSSDVSYRHMLLVEPVQNGAQIDFAPITIHAGGMAWVGDWLYVADTSHGFRVFDMSNIQEVATGKNVIGYDEVDGLHYAANYKYVVMQVGNYERQGSCNPRFSFVALDRSTDPPALISGEYDSSSLFGRLFHWPLANGVRLASPRSFPSNGYFAMHSHLQGAVSQGATHWLSSSEPPAGEGDLYVAEEGVASQILGWVDAPEDLMLDGPRNKLWSSSEGDGERYVFAVSPIP